ncbi:MAG TPA: pyridoxal phosphate-dependent aminotransferase [Candidatus Xenobia bacterium]|jgi:aspartate/methionine/tyrosine aminotransferase
MATIKLAARIERMGGEGAAQMIAKARRLESEGRPIIHLEVGEPDFDTPVHIKRRAEEALAANQTHYASSQGLLQLREALSHHLRRSRGVAVSPDRIAVSPGCKDMIFSILSVLVEDGDEVLCCAPAYPAYATIVEYLGGRAVPVPLHEALDFRFDVDEMARLITPRTRLLVLNSPQNPTGGVLTRQDVERIAALAEEKDILILTDEIYSRMVYEGEYHSIYSLPGMVDRTMLVDGFSKSHAMTGWRLGYAAMPLPVCQRVTRLLINSVSSVTTFVQWAGIAALEGPQEEVVAMVAEFARRRVRMVEGLNRLPGVTCRSPQGAFYVFPNIRPLGRPSAELADYLLESAGVATLPGTAFGAAGEGYLRLSYANSIENIERALQQMDAALAIATKG